MVFLKVDENMQKAQERDASRQQRFWFRKNITGKRVNTENGAEPNGNGTADVDTSKTGGDEYELMTIDQIINGKGSFPGLVPLIHSYLSSMDVDADTHCTIQQYLRLIQRRASGEVLTMASWIRQEVLSHPDYKLVFFLFFGHIILNISFYILQKRFNCNGTNKLRLIEKGQINSGW